MNRLAPAGHPAAPTGQPAPSLVAALPQRLQEAQAQQALAELFPHLRREAYNALRDLFPTTSAA